MSIRRFASMSILAGIALAAAGAANADVFLKVEGTPGDAMQRGFEGQILLTGATMSISNFVMPDPEGVVENVHSTNVGSLFLNKAPDRSSPKFMMAAVQGAPLGTIEITFTSPARSGGGQVVESRWILEGAEVRSFNAFPDGANANTPAETIELSYSSMRYQYFPKDAKGQRTGGMEEVKWSVPEGQFFPGDEGCR